MLGQLEKRMNMKIAKILGFSMAVLGLTACAVPGEQVYYSQGFEPVWVYPEAPFTSESIIIEGRPYYRHYHEGRAFYHHRR